MTGPGWEVSELFDPAGFISEATKLLKQRAGSRSAVVACSGGVDSTVCAELVRRAIGGRAVAVFIDDGMRREGEPERVAHALGSMGLKVTVVQASQRFFGALKGIGDAELKRKAFRETFYSTLADVARGLGADLLVQGTIAADVVETVGGVKTQHNVLGQIGLDTARYGFSVIEPLVELYKPQVRQVARELGLEDKVSEAMPFPGPGLMIRVVGEVTPERISAVRTANKIVEEEMKGSGAFQAFAALIPVRATGTKEGRRTYGNIVSIRMVESEDALSATASDIPMEALRRIAERIVNEVDDVSRCVYDVTNKPPATIEYE